jgi:hypothetical protein
VAKHGTGKTRNDHALSSSQACSLPPSSSVEGPRSFILSFFNSAGRDVFLRSVSIRFIKGV